MRSAAGGPCCHCGTAITPCWRKGPAEKPVLCNACGARWLVKADLNNYMPGKKCSGGSSRAEKHGSENKPPRVRASIGGVAKRKVRDAHRFEAQSKRFFTVYDDMEKVSQAFFFKPTFYVDAAGVSATSDSDGSFERGTPDSIQREANYDGFSSDVQEAEVVTTQTATTSALLHTSARSCGLPNFNRRPRKQSRPVACA